MPNTPASDSNSKFYTLKPEKPDGFKKAVAWFGGRELIASMKGVIMYAIYGENMDPRSWMKPNIYPNVEEKVKSQKEDKEESKVKKKLSQSDDDFNKFNSVVSTQVCEILKNSEEVQTDTEKKLAQEWGRKILDYWQWKRMHFEFWEKYLSWKDNAEEPKLASALLPEIRESADRKTDEVIIKEFWFDYIADSGDGQMGVYNVACMCFSDLWIEKNEKGEEFVGADVKFYPKKESGNSTNESNVKDGFTDDEKKEIEQFSLLPRGYFLFVGGDTAYHSANYETLFERFQKPFRWGFTSVRKLLIDRYEPYRKPSSKPVKKHGNRKARSKMRKMDFRPRPVKKIYWNESEFLPAREKPQNPFKDYKPILGENSQPNAEWDGTISRKINKKLYWDTEPPRPFFGIPANHDYYDSIDGFNRQFRRSPFSDFEENMVSDGGKGRTFLQIPSFSREQEASYIAVRLPFDWWFFGIDSENEKLDFRQEFFFSQIMEKKPRKLILATPEPTTVFGRKCSENDKTAIYLKTITEPLGFKQPFLTDGKFQRVLPGPVKNETNETYAGFCRLDLSGDVHHYARYWGPETEEFKKKGLSLKKRLSSDHYASLVAGGAGAFFDTTSTLIGETENDQGRKIPGEIPPQQVYPSPERSIDSTADKIFDLRNIKKGGYIQYGGIIFAVAIFFFLTQFSYFKDIFPGFDNIKNDDFYVLCLLILSLGFTAWAARNLNDLIKKIKEKILELKVADDETRTESQSTQVKQILELARFWRLFLNVSPFFSGALLYVLFVIPNSFGLLRRPDGFINSLFLLTHLGEAALLVWLSFEYTNWLAIRFKVARRFKQKTFTEKLEDPNESADDFLKESFTNTDGIISGFFFKLTGGLLRVFGGFSRKVSYKYIPAVCLVALAAFALIFGIGIFGNTDLAYTLADLLLVLVAGGGFLLLAYILAFNVGASYLPLNGKIVFLIIGAWHAILQLFTPLILFYFAHWIAALSAFFLIILLSGSSIAAARVNSYVSEPARDGKTTWRENLRTIVNYGVGAWLMKKKSKTLITVGWAMLGLSIIAAGVLFYSRDESLNDIVFTKSRDAVAYFTNSADAKKYINWVYLSISFLILGVIGYRISRIWFSWYLGVSVLFNGHNNEAGGLARIEGFKHILRIKVQDKALTVYVIGMDEAESDINKLKLKLVDKFELTCS